MPPIKTFLLRQEKELQEFFEFSGYKNVKKVSGDTVELEDMSGCHWKIVRNLNFWTQPPRIFQNGKEIQANIEYNPSYSTVRWLLIIMNLV
jgi:hypothetical protein